jgi:hypothetical protein
MPLPTNPDGTGVTGAGKFSSPETRQVYSWTCPACGNKVTTPLEQGCPACAERNKHAVKGQRPEEVTEEMLRVYLLRNPGSPIGGQSIRARGLTPEARRTIFRALAYAAETQPGMFVQTGKDDLLEKHVALAWARLLNQADAEESPKAIPPPTTD